MHWTVRRKPLPQIAAALALSGCVTLDEARHPPGLGLLILREEMELNELLGLSRLRKAVNLRTWTKIVKKYLGPVLGTNLTFQEFLFAYFFCR